MSTATLNRPAEAQAPEVHAPPLPATTVQAPAPRHQPTAPLYVQRPTLTAKEKVGDACVVAIAGPAYLVASIAAAGILAASGVYAAAATWRDQRRYSNQPGC